MWTDSVHQRNSQSAIPPGLAESTSSSSLLPERTLKLIVEYDGTGLCGWQRQDNGPTVQQHLEEAISSMTAEDNTILGASRTDAGVHALGQTCIFKTRREITCSGVRRGINTALPQQISVRSVEEVAAEFHPRFDARGKHYCYTLLNRRPPAPLHRITTWHRPMHLDIEAMQRAADVLVGEHDFSAFRAAGCGANTPDRRIDKISVSREEDLVRIEVWGNAFLRNMVRIIAGTLVDAGIGKTSPEQLREILESLDRRLAGQTAPPQGLCLLEVFYAE
ncbi:MAG: tRNA pseudouridine(38-40) synthase TruA [Myxococcales bacterium]|nr:tRNA pseudouridine(38-40) synthase TruA [Myxococcales bacterium]